MTGEDKEFIRAREGIFTSATLDPGVTTAGGTPSLSFGDGDTGFRESSDDNLRVALGGTDRFTFNTTSFSGDVSTAFSCRNEASGATNPTLAPNRADVDTGIGWAAADALSLITGGIEAIRLTEASSEIIQTHSANVGLTADAGSSQGDGVILSSYNVYDTVGTAGDAATLPSSFDTGMIIYVKNDAAANAMDIFPASGDDLGAGANNPLSLAVTKSAIFLATASNSTWTNLLEAI